MTGVFKPTNNGEYLEDNVGNRIEPTPRLYFFSCKKIFERWNGGFDGEFYAAVRLREPVAMEGIRWHRDRIDEGRMCEDRVDVRPGVLLLRTFRDASVQGCAWYALEMFQIEGEDLSRAEYEEEFGAHPVSSFSVNKFSPFYDRHSYTELMKWKDKDQIHAHRADIYSQVGIYLGSNFLD